MVRRSLYGAGGRPNVRSVIDCGVVSFRIPPQCHFVKNHKGPGDPETNNICCACLIVSFLHGVSAEVGKATATAAVPSNAPCAFSSSFRLHLRPLLPLHCTSTHTSNNGYQRQVRPAAQTVGCLGSEGIGRDLHRAHQCHRERDGDTQEPG